MKTVVIFGAGPATGLSVARRFGREGYQVVLVARRKESLAELAGQLPGVPVTTFVADVFDHQRLAAVVATIGERFGTIDVAVWTPGGLEQKVVAVRDVDPDELPTQLNVLLLAPIALTRLLLPGMIERGDGALLFASGMSAITPMPQLGNVGIALAGMRNYVHNIGAVVADDGVYVGIVPIGGVIRGSAVNKMIEATPDAFEGIDAGDLPIVEPDDIADVFWNLQHTRDRAEQPV